MSNQLTKDLEILFESVIDSFEASNVVSASAASSDRATLKCSALATLFIALRATT
mgnify:CR=1 FL=1